jgi:hypothetical protein
MEGGIWPIGRRIPAQRNSVNRPAGTLERTNGETNVWRCTKRVDQLEIVPAVLIPLLEYPRPNYTNHYPSGWSNSKPEDNIFHKALNDLALQRARCGSC